MAYTGKQFEEDFKNSIPESLFPRLTRLYDTTNGFAGIKNPCDFILFHQGIQLNLELKTVKGERMPFTNVTEFQWSELVKRDQVPGMIGALLIHFQTRNCVYLMPLHILEQMRERGCKSVGIADCQCYGLQVPTKLKRTRISLDITALITDVQHWKYKEVIVEEVTLHGKPTSITE